MTLAERIKKLRLEAGMTQMETADKLGIIFQWYQKWEWGKTRPNEKNMRKLADVFDVSVEYLLGNSEERELTPAEKLEKISGALNNEQKLKLYEMAKQMLIKSRAVKASKG